MNGICAQASSNTTDCAAIASSSGWRPSSRAVRVDVIAPQGVERDQDDVRWPGRGLRRPGAGRRPDHRRHHGERRARPMPPRVAMVTGPRLSSLQGQYPPPAVIVGLRPTTVKSGFDTSVLLQEMRCCGVRNSEFGIRKIDGVDWRDGTKSGLRITAHRGNDDVTVLWRPRPGTDTPTQPLHSRDEPELRIVGVRGRCAFLDDDPGGPKFAIHNSQFAIHPKRDHGTPVRTRLSSRGRLSEFRIPNSEFSASTARRNLVSDVCSTTALRIAVPCVLGMTS